MLQAYHRNNRHLCEGNLLGSPIKNAKMHIKWKFFSFLLLVSMSVFSGSAHSQKGLTREIDISLIRELLTPKDSPIAISTCDSKSWNGKCDQPLNFYAKGLGVFSGVSSFPGFVITSKNSDMEFGVQLTTWGWRGDNPDQMNAPVQPSISCSPSKLVLGQKGSTLTLSIESKCKGQIWSNKHNFHFEVKGFDRERGLLYGNYDLRVSDFLIADAKGYGGLLLPSASRDLYHGKTGDEQSITTVSNESEDSISEAMSDLKIGDLEAEKKEAEEQQRKLAELKKQEEELKEAERLAQEATERKRVAKAEAKKKEKILVNQTEKYQIFNDKRVALVIGNAAYKSAPLDNPVNDASDIANELKRRGFKVITRNNANLRSLQQAVRDFSDEFKQSDVGLIYYSGHGVETKGQNYLIPVDADIKKEYELSAQAYPASQLTAMMEEVQSSDDKKRVAILILDACRDNPLTRSWRSSGRGLARMDAPAGTFISFSTSPGSVASDGRGRNSPFTKHLLQAISKPDVPIELMFKQVRVGVMDETKGEQIPWDSSSLTGDFYFSRSVEK
jgi:hypothetical protein